MKTKEQCAQKRNSTRARPSVEKTNAARCLLEMEVVCALPGGYQVPENLVAAIKSQVNEIEPYLARNHSITLEVMCDPAFWAQLTPGGRRVADMCMAYLIDKGEVVMRVTHTDPLEPVTYQAV